MKLLGFKHMDGSLYERWDSPLYLLTVSTFVKTDFDKLPKRALTLVLPSLFCNMVYQEGWYHPLMNLKLTGPKYDCLVPWCRVGSPLCIDTKIMKIGQRMTSQWRFQTWPDSKSGFSVNRPKLKKKINFLAKKVPNIRISPGFLLVKKRNGVSNMSWKF